MRWHREAPLIGAFALAFVSWMSGCGGGSGASTEMLAESDTPVSSVPSQTQPPGPESFDPPRKFAAEGTPLLGVSTLAMALIGTTGYFAVDGGLQISDTRSATQIATVAPSTPMAPGIEGISGVTVGAPSPIASDGKELIVVPFALQPAGQGTSAPTLIAEIVAVDPVNSTTVWTVRHDLPDWAFANRYQIAIKVVGVNDGALVVGVEYGDGQKATVFALDVNTHDVLWTKDDFRAAAIAGGNVVGVSSSVSKPQRRLTAVRSRDGESVWTSKMQGFEPVVAAGPTFVLAQNEEPSSDVLRRLPITRLRIVDGNSGTELNSPLFSNIPLFDSERVCRFDGLSVTVCSATGGYGSEAIGLDSTTGEFLWELPDKKTKRVAPRVTAVLHGAVYGTTDNGPVVLDAKTGADLENTAVIAPSVVNDTTGVVDDVDIGGVRAYAAIG